MGYINQVHDLQLIVILLIEPVFSINCYKSSIDLSVTELIRCGTGSRLGEIAKILTDL